MKIISESFMEVLYEVLKPFQVAFKNGIVRTVPLGEKLNFKETRVADDRDSILQFIKDGLIAPPLPEKALYRVRRPFPKRVPSGLLIKCETNDVCEILAKDAVSLLMDCTIEPIDATVWRPYKLDPTGRQPRIIKESKTPFKKLGGPKKPGSDSGGGFNTDY